MITKTAETLERGAELESEAVICCNYEFENAEKSRENIFAQEKGY